MYLSKFIRQNGITLERWKRVVSVMLEKAPVNFVVEKIRALLLIEENYNALHKITFKGRLLPSLEVLSSTPKDIMGGVEDHKMQ